MTGNAYFPTPNPTLAAITLLTDELETAEAAMDGSRLKTEQRDIALDAFTTGMQSLQSYVNGIAAGNVEKVLSSGFEVRNPRTVPVKLGPVTELTIKLGSTPGSIDLNWKGIKGTKLYGIEYSISPNAGNWEGFAESTKSKVTVEELSSNQVYYFRIACINAAGVGPWSEVISIRVY